MFLILCFTDNKNYSVHLAATTKKPPEGGFLQK